MKRRAERNGERSRAKLNEANKRIRPGKLNSPGWIEVVQHTKAWDPEMYQEAYIFNQPRFLSRRAFHFYPSCETILALASQTFASRSATSSIINEMMKRTDISDSFPETTNSIISEIISPTTE